MNAAVEEVDRELLKSFLREALVERIQSGQFDEQWTKTQEVGTPILEELLARLSRHPIVEAERRLRDMLGAGQRYSAYT
jgi:ketol-acid reductoisomerase